MDSRQRRIQTPASPLANILGCTQRTVQEPLVTDRCRLARPIRQSYKQWGSASAKA